MGDTNDMRRLLNAALKPEKPISEDIKKMFTEEFWVFDKAARNAIVGMPDTLTEGWMDDATGWAKKMIGKAANMVQGIIDKVKTGTIDKDQLESSLATARERLINSFETVDRNKIRITVATANINQAQRTVADGPDEAALAKATVFNAPTAALQVKDYKAASKKFTGGHSYVIIFDVDKKTWENAEKNISKIPQVTIKRGFVGVLQVGEGINTMDDSIKYPNLPKADDVEAAIKAGITNAADVSSEAAENAGTEDDHPDNSPKGKKDEKPAKKDDSATEEEPDELSKLKDKIAKKLDNKKLTAEDLAAIHSYIDDEGWK